MIYHIDLLSSCELEVREGTPVPFDVTFDLARGRLCVAHPDMPYYELDARWLVGPRPRELQIWVGFADVLLMSREHASSMARLEVGLRVLERIQLERDPEGVCARDEFLETDLGPVFFYERGLIAFDTRGHVRWRRDGLAVDDYPELISGDRVQYTNRDGSRWSYDLASGALRD